MDRVPLYLQMHTREGDNHDAWIALQQAVGITVSDEVRNARAPQPRNTMRRHTYGECSRGVSRCRVHRQEYRGRLAAAKAIQRKLEAERTQQQITASNVVRIHAMRGAPMQESA